MTKDIPKLGAPIVLVHGLLGVTRLEVGGWRLASYFQGIPEMLRAGGNRVLVPQLSLTAGVADRAAQLKAFLDREAPGEAVQLNAHTLADAPSPHLIRDLPRHQRVC